MLVALSTLPAAVAADLGALSSPDAIRNKMTEFMSLAKKQMMDEI